MLLQTVLKASREHGSLMLSCQCTTLSAPGKHPAGAEAVFRVLQTLFFFFCAFPR